MLTGITGNGEKKQGSVSLSHRPLHYVCPAMSRVGRRPNELLFIYFVAFQCLLYHDGCVPSIFGWTFNLLYTHILTQLRSKSSMFSAHPSRYTLPICSGRTTRCIHRDKEVGYTLRPTVIEIPVP